MTRDIFLQELRIALQGQIPQAQVNEHLQYYENYIMEESRKGRTEEQVIEALGNPRLIAKTIIETSKQEGTQENEQKTEEQSYGQAKAEHSKGFHINFDEKSGWDVRYGRFKINSWYGYLLIALVVIVVFVFIAKLAFVLLPVVIPVILVAILLYLLFFGNRK